MSHFNPRRFLASYLLELRLNCTHWSYLLLLAIWSVFIVSQYLNDSLMAIRAMFNFVVGFSSLIGLVMVAVQASRAHRSRFDLLEIAFPTGFELVLARWGASLTSLLILFVPAFIVALFIPATHLDIDYAIINFIQAIISLGFISGFIWLIQTLFGIRRWMYPFLIGLWLLSGMLPNAPFFRNNNLPIPGTNLVNFVVMDVGQNWTWGNLATGNLPQWIRLFYVGIIVLILGVLWWHFGKTRLQKLLLPAVSVTSIAALLIGYATVNDVQEVVALNQAIEDEQTHLNIPYTDLLIPQDTPIVVDEYVIEFNPHTAEFVAQMHVRNRGDVPLDQFPFSLYYQFEITEASLPYTREDSFVTFMAESPLNPAETLQLQITYQGALWSLETSYNSAPIPKNFIRPNGVNLIYDIIWYPMPGHVLPNRLIFHPETNRLIHYTLLDEPAQFELSISPSDTLDFASNLLQISENSFVSEGATWASLVGIPNLETTSLEHLHIITRQRDTEFLAPPVSNLYTPFMSYMREHFDNIPDLNIQVLEIPSESWARYPPPIAENLFLLLSPRNVDWQDDITAQYNDGISPLLNAFFGENDAILTRNINFFIWFHYTLQGDAQAIQTAVQGDLNRYGSRSSYLYTENDPYLVVKLLSEIYTEDGEATVFRILNQFRENMAELAQLTSEEVIIWMETQRLAN